jgi:hypothetical protein
VPAQNQHADSRNRGSVDETAMRQEELERNETDSSGTKCHVSKMELWLSEDGEARRRFLKQALSEAAVDVDTMADYLSLQSKQAAVSKSNVIESHE